MLTREDYEQLNLFFDNYTGDLSVDMQKLVNKITAIVDFNDAQAHLMSLINGESNDQNS